MIAALDSSLDAPSADQARAAGAAGVRVWCGYLATRAGVGLEVAWPELAFWNASQAGGTPIAFASGWDDPLALRQLAAAWQVRLALDCESGIRDLGEGGWNTQAWLDASGAGLYGLARVHVLRAPFHIVARYPGFDPRATWDARAGPRPPAPCGWQWQGTHPEFGRSVDRLWLDDWFAGGDPMDPNNPIDRAAIIDGHTTLTLLYQGRLQLPDVLGGAVVDGTAGWLGAQLAALQAKADALLAGEGAEEAAIAALGANAAASGQLTALASALSAVKVELDQVAAAQAGGTPADLGALQTAIALVDQHLQATGRHLGVGTA